MFEKDGVQYYNLLRDDVIKLIPKNLQLDSVLDVGCGEGINLQYLKEHMGAKRVTGVEINEDIARKAEKRIDVVINESIENPQL